ncbi:MAG: hypothetical protein EA361_12725 [Bacteroidetes bacterium]|nr:MAG: hypothetical protein EA361_12725 [Bacteroidota bacterium]
MNMYFGFILLFGISGGEIFIILLLILLLFGPKKIPEIARTLGKGINEIKKVQRDINAEIHRYSEEIENPAKEMKEDIEGFSKGLSDIENVSPENPPANIDSEQSGEIDESGPAVTDTDELPYPYNQAEKNRDSSVDEQEKNDSAPQDQKKAD